ncbi:MAG: ATP-dependent helicase [Spirochaetia bacterium]
MKSEGDRAYLRELNPEQYAAVIHSGSPLLILAGAGSGKTRVITTKIAYAIDTLALPAEAILAVTFTNKAALEMRSRVSSLIPGAERVMIRTFHSFGAWLLRKYGAKLGIDPGFLIYDEDDSLALLKQDLKDAYDLSGIKQYLYWIQRAKDLAVLPGRELSQVSHDRDLPAIYASYQEHLDATGNLDFGDLIMKSVELLRECPAVSEKIRGRFRMILVDEYQDSNVAQFKLLQEIYGQETYLCVVGDDDQSIYKFRGAEIENILGFPEHFPHTKIIRLEQNYRSTQKILEAASAVVAHNKNRMGKTLVTANSEGKDIVAAYLRDHQEEAEFCAEVIRDGAYKETAILYRMNYQSRHFEELFLRSGIPYQIVGTQRFYEREEIKDALCYLALLQNPNDELAFRRVVNKPSRGIGKISLEKILERRKQNGADFITCCRESGRNLSKNARTGTDAFLACLDSLASRLETGKLSDFIHLLIETSGLLAYYEKKDAAEGTGKCSNLLELINAAMPYPSGKEGLLQFLENTLLNNPETEDPEQGKVTLITVHNTKGLEFERVIITGLEEGVFPSFPGTDPIDASEEEIEEERRLFYVGITRAKEELYLTSCRKRPLYGRFITSMPSRFLAEIPAHLVMKYDNTAVNQEHSASYDQFCRGARVFHDDYGYGIVVKHEARGEHSLVTVRFDTGRSARFIPDYSSLVRIKEEF